MTVQKAAQVIAVVGAALLALFWYPSGWPLALNIDELYANLAAEFLGIALTVLLIDRLYSEREKKQLKKRLIWEMGSMDQAFAIRAAKEMRDAGWLTDGTLAGADLTLANLSSADLSGADLANADLDQANISHTDLQEAGLAGASLDNCTGERTILKGADLSGASMRRARFPQGQFDGANLNFEVDLLRAHLAEASFRDAELVSAKLEEADLLKCDFFGADLNSANLHGADVSGCSFANASLERADLANLQNWQQIHSIEGASISGIRNAPEGFRDWAIASGAEE